MKVKELKAAILKKGWAGRTLSRAETARRLNPLIKAHMALNHAYDCAARRCRNPEEQASLSELQKTARIDVGKLMETVFSCGAAAFNGTEMEPEQFVLPDGKEFTALRNQEEAFLVQLQEEKTLEHQLRTEAVLNCLTRSSQMRLEFLRACIRDNRA